jgi:asparagine synthase (glutamine-hydrolysing)
MCGICYANFKLKNIDNVIKTLKNRGPDFQDYKIIDNKTFIHTRLSIIDLDKRSNQPFIKNDIVLIFNGEIYNYKKIKKELLQNYKFDTESDTEVILALYETYGTDSFKHLNGMFAFVLYDIKSKETYFLRDPSGIKPLYMYYNDDKLILTSKIQTILTQFDLSLDYRAINDILAYGYTKKPCYRSIYEVEPGILYKGLQKSKINFIIDKNKTIKDCIIEQFVNSDRPVGILLSGGIDSGYIAYVCSNEALKNNKQIHTFTIGFTEKDPDIINSRKIAKHINSIHHEIIISKDDYGLNLKEGLNKIGMPIDLGSVSLVNAIGKEISKTNIKVLLSGDGSDEINAGYKRYNECSNSRTAELWEWYKKRILKNDYEERKKILKDNVNLTDINDNGYPNNSNKMLWCDFQNELIYYHLKRMDHIISDYGIELRVPYCDYNYIINMFNKNFVNKINNTGNKLLLRKFAIDDGYPEEFANIPKIPMKNAKFDSKENLQKIIINFIVFKKNKD